tara:strand:- start:115 stop:471 length:357 start_codon:yes stop_codon:yes gene_type:complete
MKLFIKVFALTFLTLVIIMTYVKRVEAGGPWSDQYCNVEVTQIKVVDMEGNVLDTRIEEKVTCNDGAMDFLHGMGIAKACQIYTWEMPLGETTITQRDIACEKLNGEYEIVEGYHSIE